MSSNVRSPNFYSNWIIWIMEHNFYDQVHVLFFIIIMIKTETFYNHDWYWVFILPISLALNQFETCRTLFCFQKNLSSVEELLWCILFTDSKAYQCLSVRMGFLPWKLNTHCWSLHRFLLLSSLLSLPERRSSIWTLIISPDFRSTAPYPPHYRMIWKLPSGIFDNLPKTSDMPEY